MSTPANRTSPLEVPRAVDPGASNSKPSNSGKRPNSEQAFFQLDLTRSLQLHQRLALSIAAVGLVLGIVYYFAMAPVYLAQCLVYVQPAPPSVIQQGYSNRWPYDATTYDSYIQQQIQNVMREDVLTGALKKLGDAARKPNESDQDALDRLRRQLDVARVGQTYQFTIGARASNPELAAQTANAVAASYIESTSHDQRAGDEQRLTMLREERDRVHNALDADRIEQQDLNKQLGVASVGSAPDHFDEDIAEIRTELVKARTDHDAAEAKFTAMGANHGASSNPIDAAADEIADSDAGLVSMKTALNARRALLISKMANLTPGNPEYKQDAAELAQINSNLDQMMKDLRTRAASRIQLQLRSELERTAGVEAQLNTQLRQLVSSATNATSKLQRSSDLAADITRLQSRYSAVDEQLHNLMLEDAAPTGAYVSTPADVPNHRAKSGRTRNALAIVMAGLLIGLIAAVVAHKLDRHVYVASDVEGVLGFAPLGLLPDFAEVSEGAAEEHLMRLAAAIEHAHKQGHLRSCVVTGASSGAGVTTIVTRVRALLEAMGQPTVCVDASGTSEENEPAAAGREASQALVTATRRNRQSALSEQRSNEGEDESLVLTDAAPIAVSAETEYLVRFADCAIVIVESGVTTRAEIRDAATTLQRLNVGAVGFVLNRIGLAKADPAFRASVEAIEKHLQSQMGAAARRTERTEAVSESNVPRLTITPYRVSARGSAVDSRPPASNTQQASPHAENLQLSNPQTVSHQPPSSQPAIPQPPSPQASADNAPASADPARTESARLEPITNEPTTAESTRTQPTWMVGSGRPSSLEPSASKVWTSPASPAPASASAAAEAAPHAHIINPEPAPSSERIGQPQPAAVNQPQPVSTNQPEPASFPTIAAPFAQQAETQVFHLRERGRDVGTFPGPTHASPLHGLADARPVEPGEPPSWSSVESSDAPTTAVPAVHQSLWAQREHLAVPAQPEPPLGNESQTAHAAAGPPAQPAPEQESDVPWWLSDSSGHRAEQPIPLLWFGEKTDKSRREESYLAPDPVEFPLHADPSRKADPARKSDLSRMADLSRNPAQSPAADSSGPNRAASPQQPPVSERSAVPNGHSISPPPQGLAQWTQQEDSPDRLTSRLSGLRSLLAGLGLKEIHSSARNPDPRATDPRMLHPDQAETAPLNRTNVPPEDQSRSQQISELASSSPHQGPGPRSREVSPQPEYLKPAPTASEYETGDAGQGEKSLVRTFQPGRDIEALTLPSKRGQYRNL
jgi:polysaccharide biosynthesis transport protein